MIKLVFKIFLDNIKDPFEFILDNNEKYSFNYGFGKEQWGSHNLRFKVKLYTFDKNYNKIMQEYLENLFPHLNNYENIKEIIFEFINDENNDQEIFSFKKNEFSNFNMTQVIDEKHKTTFTITFNINSTN